MFRVPLSDPQNTKRFWCSAFVGYFLTRMGILSYKTKWSDLRPSDFAENNLDFINKYYLGEIDIVKN